MKCHKRVRSRLQRASAGVKMDILMAVGDLRLVKDFVRVVRGEQPSASTTDLMDSIHGHEIGYAADQAMRRGCVINLNR